MSASKKKLAVKVIPQTEAKAVGTVVFLHGSGDTGQGFHDYVSSTMEVLQLQFPHLRILYPTAPLRRYAVTGQLSNVWYNRQQISPSAPDDETVDESASLLSDLIKQESLEQGIPVKNMLIGGLSMGGGMALQLAFRYYREVAGVFAMSSFLGNQSLVYQALQTDKSQTPPLFQSHGEQDDLVLYDWGKDTFKRLTGLGVKGEFHSVPDVLHVMDKETLLKLSKWITERIPVESSLADQ